MAKTMADSRPHLRRMSSNMTSNSHLFAEVNRTHSSLPRGLTSAVSPPPQDEDRPSIPVCPLPDSRIIPNEEKQRIFELISKYGSINLCNFPVVYKLFHNSDLVETYHRFGYKSLEEFIENMPNLVRLEKTSNGIKVRIAPQMALTSTPTKTKTSIVDLKPRNQLINGFKNKDNKEVNELTNTSIDLQKFVSNEELIRFWRILRNNPKGVTPEGFTQQYYQLYGQPLIPKKWSFSSTLEMFAHLSDIFYIKKQTNGSNGCQRWLLFESTPELKSRRVPIESKRKRFDEVFKKRVMNLIEKCSKSDIIFMIEDFADAYRLLFGEPIDPKTYGYEDFCTLLKELSKECDFDVKEKYKNQPFLTLRKKFF